MTIPLVSTGSTYDIWVGRTNQAIGVINQLTDGTLYVNGALVFSNGAFSLSLPSINAYNNIVLTANSGNTLFLQSSNAVINGTLYVTGTANSVYVSNNIVSNTIYTNNLYSKNANIITISSNTLFSNTVNTSNIYANGNITIDANGSITAKRNLSANSGILYANAAIIGSNGILSTGTIATLTTSINSGQNISANSGIIFGTRAIIGTGGISTTGVMYANNNLFSNFIQASNLVSTSNISVTNYVFTKNVSATGYLTVTNNITASGNISGNTLIATLDANITRDVNANRDVNVFRNLNASGYIFANTAVYTNGPISMTGSNYIYGPGSYINMQYGRLTFGAFGTNDIYRIAVLGDWTRSFITVNNYWRSNPDGVIEQVIYHENLNYNPPINQTSSYNVMLPTTFPNRFLSVRYNLGGTRYTATYDDFFLQSAAAINVMPGPNTSCVTVYVYPTGGPLDIRLTITAVGV